MEVTYKTEGTKGGRGMSNNIVVMPANWEGGGKLIYSTTHSSYNHN